MPRRYHSVQAQYLRLEHPELGTKSGKTRTRHVRQPLITGVASYTEQLLHSSTSNRGNDAKFGKMSPDGVDHRNLLADQKMARAMQYQAALLELIWNLGDDD